MMKTKGKRAGRKGTRKEKPQARPEVVAQESIFGRRLRELRKAKGWTQHDLGERLGVNYQTVSRWERSGHAPELQALPAIASVLGVSPDFLLGYQMDLQITPNGDEYRQRGFLGEGIWDAAYDVLKLLPSVRQAREPGPIRLLNVGCGTGQTAVFFARYGCAVSAFDISTTSLKRGKSLAADNRVNINFFQANLMSCELNEDFDAVYGQGVLKYVPVKYRKRVMENLKAHTAVGGLNVLDCPVEKSFIEAAEPQRAGSATPGRAGSCSPTTRGTGSWRGWTRSSSTARTASAAWTS